jgi:hypothetical protein
MPNPPNDPIRKQPEPGELPRMPGKPHQDNPFPDRQPKEIPLHDPPGDVVGDPQGDVIGDPLGPDVIDPQRFLRGV